jgi:hypothetical protein
MEREVFEGQKMEFIDSLVFDCIPWSSYTEATEWGPVMMVRGFFPLP